MSHDNKHPSERAEVKLYRA